MQMAKIKGVELYYLRYADCHFAEVIMNNLSLFACLCLLFSIAGCAVDRSAGQFADVSSPQPEIIQNLPLQATVLITEEMEKYLYTMKIGDAFVCAVGKDSPGCQFTFPLGQMIKGNAVKVFSPVFFRTVQVKGGPYPEGTDVVITPSVVRIKYWYENTSFSKSTAYATTAVKVSVHDTKGKLVWERVINSPGPTEKLFSSFSTDEMVEATGSVANESVVLNLRQAAKEMASAGELHAYVAAKSKPTGPLVALSSETASPVKSDIDELPVLQARKNSHAYAIVIGIEQYRQKLPKADFATQDAKLVAAYLTKVLGYSEENVITLLNDHASNVDLAKYFEKWLPNNVEKDSTVFVYYSGHGAPDPKSGSAYLVPYDGDPSFIDQTGYSLKRVYDALGKLPAKEVIIALDSCFSGAGGRSVIAKGSRPLVMNLQSNVVLPKNMTVLSASAGDQTSSTYDEKGHGLFTYFMLKGIKNEDVVKQDGSIKMDDLFSYIKPQVERIARKQFNNEQTPQLIGAKKN